MSALQEVELPGDREGALAVVSARLRSDTPGYTAHTGDLDWWWYHRAPDEGYFVTLAGPDAVVHLELARRAITVFGDDAPWLDEGIAALSPGPVTVELVGESDTERSERLRAAGFRPLDQAMLAFHHDLTAIPSLVSACGRVTTMADGIAPESRADAARAAFHSPLAADVHRARYRSFMSSPGYVPAHDVVVVDDDDEVASFSMWWADPSGIAQIEPMGTRPLSQRHGMGSAALQRCLVDARSEGMHLMRVITSEGRPAVDFYQALGFRVVDRLLDWQRA